MLENIQGIQADLAALKRFVQDVIERDLIDDVIVIQAWWRGSKVFYSLFFKLVIILKVSRYVENAGDRHETETKSV